MITGIFFSPTHSTRKIVRAVAAGMTDDPQQLDLTFSQAEKSASFTKDDVCVIGVPVYGGRVPPLMTKALQGIKGQNTPAVLVAVYGNRAWEDTLLELSDTVRANGFRPVAAAAFLAQHSYTAKAAGGRPTEEDLGFAKKFGEKALSCCKKEGTLQLPGNRPYKPFKAGEPWTPEPTAECTQCGECAKVCPVQIIPNKPPYVVQNPAECIHCCACLKECPIGARKLLSPAPQNIIRFLEENCTAHKDPEYFYLP